MTYRNRNLLNLSWEAPCFLQIAAPCGQDKSVPCHSDLLRHGRGVGHKSADCFAVPGCPNCHAIFTREHLGKGGYEEVWIRAMERYLVWLWENGKIKTA